MNKNYSQALPSFPCLDYFFLLTIYQLPKQKKNDAGRQSILSTPRYFFFLQNKK